MKILIVSATEKEVNLLLQKTDQLNKTGLGLYSGNSGKLKIEFLITGVGLPFTVYQLTKQLLGNNYDFVINAGIAGAFKNSIEIGSVVNIINECFADLGIDNRGEFQTIFDMGFLDKNSSPFICGKLTNNLDFNQYDTIKDLLRVSGITINKASGEENDILKKISKFNPDVESMEGAGIFYVCQNLNVPFIEIRSISNFVEARDIKKWNIPLAIINLSEQLLQFLKELESKL